MAKDLRRNTELGNVSETWDENERKRSEGYPSSREDETPTQRGNAMEQRIRREAAEYDEGSSDNRRLTGDRASVNDEPEP